MKCRPTVAIPFRLPELLALVYVALTMNCTWLLSFKRLLLMSQWFDLLMKVANPHVGICEQIRTISGGPFSTHFDDEGDKYGGCGGQGQF
jgi:hypothetical protein